MKTINTPREELICGKIDLIITLIQNNNLLNALEIINYIRDDAEKMEQKLISRKKEVKTQDIIRNFSDQKIASIANEKFEILNNDKGENPYGEGKFDGFIEGVLYIQKLLNE
jgi:hypothetical protein